MRVVRSSCCALDRTQVMEMSNLGIKRQLKRAKLFEIHKLVRQIRTLENRKGTDVQVQKTKRKVERLVEVLDAIKDINLGQLAEEVSRTILGGGELPSTRDVAEQGPSGSCVDRAKHRLLTNKSFQRNISRLCEPTTGRGSVLRTGVSEKEEEEEGEGEGEGEEEGEEGLVEVEKPSGGTDYGGNDRSHPGKERWTAEDSDAEVSGSSTNESERELDQETSDSSEQESDHIVSDAGACGRETNTGQVSKPRKTKKCQTVQEKGVGMVRKNVESNEAAVLSESVSRSLPLESAFVGALSASSHSLANHSRTTAKKPKSNRPGQRRRQKKWEEMFGETATHLAEGKRQQKGRLKGKRKKMAMRTNNSVPHTRPEKSTTASSDTQLHPSWEAQRRKKARETAIPQFLGQKTVFSD